MTDQAASGPAPWPDEIRYDRETRLLHIQWEDGVASALEAELLRVESPSAEVQGHGGPDGKVLVAGRRHVGIIGIEPVGNYAVRLSFDDLHDTGIYSWTVLRRLHDRQADLWRAYEAALAAAGKSRDP